MIGSVASCRLLASVEAEIGLMLRSRSLDELLVDGVEDNVCRAADARNEGTHRDEMDEGVKNDWVCWTSGSEMCDVERGSEGDRREGETKVSWSWRET